MRPLSRLLARSLPVRTRVVSLLLLALALTPARSVAQSVVEGQVSVASQGLRLLSKIPGSNPTNFSGDATGLDALIFAPKLRLGLHLQSMSAADAAVNAGTYSAQSLVALVGRPGRAAELGLGRRRGYSDQTDRDLEATYGFYRVGGRFTAPMGTLGFAVGVRGSLYAPVDFDFDDGATGFDAGTSLRWTSSRWPLTSALEYRSERFTVADGVHQELTAVTLSVGFAFRKAP